MGILNIKLARQAG